MLDWHVGQSSLRQSASDLQQSKGFAEGVSMSRMKHLPFTDGPLVDPIRHALSDCVTESLLLLSNLRLVRNHLVPFIDLKQLVPNAGPSPAGFETEIDIGLRGEPAMLLDGCLQHHIGLLYALLQSAQLVRDHTLLDSLYKIMRTSLK